MLVPLVSLVGRFTAAVQRYADAPAVADASGAWTYRELDRRSDALAAAIARRVAGPPAPVAVLARHGRKAIAALLGVMKAGAAAAPLDTSLPPEALQEHLTVLGARAVVADEAGLLALAKLPDWRERVIPVEPMIELPGRSMPPTEAVAALVYFSSGSTGQPKTITLSHASALFGIDAYLRAMDIRPSDRVAWLTPLAFGASSSVVFGTLLSGATLVARDLKQEGTDTLPAWIRREGITVLHTVSSVFRRFAGRTAPGDLATLRLVKLGGEPVRASDFDLFKSVCMPGCIFINGLGITEAGCNVTFFRADHDTSIRLATVPVGIPIDGVRIRVVDAEGRDVPAGDPGEIVVRGEHLACGDSDLRPGDRGRFLPDGNLLHLGRTGDEVKIRGQRINLASIESALLDVNGVEDALAGVLETAAGPELVACCRTALPGDELRRQFATRWPAHLVPGRIVTVAEDVPRLPNGKPNRTALPSLFEQTPAQPHVAPRDTLEKQVATIWEVALRRNPIGVHDNFFDLGGNSLTAATIAGSFERVFGEWLPLATIVQHPTIEALAAFLRSKAPKLTARRAVLVQAGPLAAPIFCVPGAGSDIFALRFLARRFAAERPFYGLQYPGLDGERQRFRTVEDIAESMLPDIRDLQPTGPLLLMGTSFGGIIAVELARRLMQEGRHVAFVGLLDTYGRGYPQPRRGLPMRHTLLVQLRRLLPLGRKDELTWSNVRAGIREHFIRARARRALRRAEGVVPPTPEQFYFLQEVCFRAREQYAFAPLPRRLHLYRAETGLPDFLYEPDPTLGWSGVAADLQVATVPGAHGQHIRDPNAPVLAKALSEAIREELGVRSQDLPELVDTTRATWDALAAWWDEAVGDSGNPHTADRLLPVTDRALGIRPGERVIDAGCGNGWFSRRLARQGATVFAFDFAPEFIRRAVARNGSAANPAFRVLDASREADLAALDTASCDAAVSTMALHDMAVIEPLIAALSRAVRPGGRFVFTVPRSGGGTTGPVPEKTIALPGQPLPHTSFRRDLPAILEMCSRHGWRHDSTEDVVLGQGSAAVSVIRLLRPISGMDV